MRMRQTARQTARQEHMLTCSPPLPTWRVAMTTLGQADANFLWKARPGPVLVISLPMTL